MRLPMIAIGIACARLAAAQTTVDLRTQSKAVDFSAAAFTKPFKTGTTLPATCQIGEAFALTSAAAGQNIYLCLTPNVWQLEGGSGSVTSVFGRTGPVTPQAGDYAFPQVTGIAAISQGGTGAATTPQALLNLGAAAANHTHPLTDIAGITGKHGSSGVLAAFGAGTTAADDCAKFDANGNVVSAGAPCNLTGSGQSNVSVSFTGQTTVTISHQLNTRNIVFQCYDASYNALEAGSFTVLNENQAQVAFASPVTGTCVVNGSGGGIGPAGGDLLGVFPNPTLTATGVTAGTYGGVGTIPVITVDAKGRLINVSTTAVSGGSGGAAGGDLTGSYPNPSLSTTGVSPGTYGGAGLIPVITVDAKGRLSGVSAVSAGGAASGDLTGSYPNPELAASGVNPGTYGGAAGIPVLTVDAKGRITSATTVPISGGGGGEIDVLAGTGIVVTGSNPKRVSLDSAVTRAFLTGVASLTFTTFQAHTCQTKTIPVIGTMTGDAVVPHWPNSLPAGLVGMMIATGTDVVTVRLCNVLASTVSPPGGLTFSATALKVF